MIENPSASPGVASPPPHGPADALWKQWVKDGIVGLSLANLVLVGAWFPILFDKDFSYFNQVQVEAPTLLALLMNLFWLAAVFFLVMRLWRNTRRGWVRFVIHGLLLAVLIVPLDFVRSVLVKLPDYQLAALFQRPLLMVLFLVFLALVAWQHRRCARTMTAAVVILSPLAWLTVVHTLGLLLGLQHLRQSGVEPAPAPLTPARPGMARVVWIIFDEVDYRLVFEQRPLGVRLPNFDQIRRESVFATNAYPPGGSTLISMPALIAGRDLAAVQVTGPSQLLLKPAEGEGLLDWRSVPSVFSRARELGANTALVGWYHPYARILGRALSYCVWFPYPTSELARGRTYGQAMAQELLAMFGTFEVRRLFIEVCRAGQVQAKMLAADPKYNLSLFHLAPPHKPGVYLPAGKSFTVVPMRKADGYFNNLALADRMLGEIRQSVVRAGLQDKTWFIVSTDHWWRESAIWDGRVDHRVPFMVRPPGSDHGVEFGAMINTVLTHDLVLAVLRGEVRDLQQAATWLERRKTTQPPAYDRQRTGTSTS
jgi:hypothetical protein